MVVLDGVAVLLSPEVAWATLPSDGIAWAGGNLDGPTGAVVASYGGDPCDRTVLLTMVVVEEDED